MNKKFLWDYKTAGIPDEFFERMDKVPITKEEIRSIIISKLRLKEGHISIDAGCGSGSISIELAIQTKATVYAIDIDKNAIDLTNQNIKKFGLENEISVIEGLVGRKRRSRSISRRSPRWQWG